MYLAAAAGEGKTFRELYVRASPSAREAPVRYETTAADFFPVKLRVRFITSN